LRVAPVLLLGEELLLCLRIAIPSQPGLQGMSESLHKIINGMIHSEFRPWRRGAGLCVTRRYLRCLEKGSGRPSLTHLIEPRKLKTNGKVALARRMFADQSHSISEICAALGISRATLYRYVKNDTTTRSEILEFLQRLEQILVFWQISRVVQYLNIANNAFLINYK
jgi:AraC-like DNA-binding protein